MSSLTENSPNMRVLSVTIPDPAASVQAGADSATADSDGAKTFSKMPCRSCLVQQFSGTQTYMAIGRAATAAATSFKLSTTPIAVPIDDVAKLNFIGTAGDVVQILVRQNQ
jgi:hypothetical protein